MKMKTNKKKIYNNLIFQKIIVKINLNNNKGNNNNNQIKFQNRNVQLFYNYKVKIFKSQLLVSSNLIRKNNNNNNRFNLENHLNANHKNLFNNNPLLKCFRVKKLKLIVIKMKQTTKKRE